MPARKAFLLLLLMSLTLGVATAADQSGDDPWASVKVENFDLEAGPIWSNEHAQKRCPEVVAEWAEENGREAKWTGNWNTTVEGEMSVCNCDAVVTETFDVEAGPIWSNDHAKERCPEVIEKWMEENPGRQAKWNGQWATTIAGEMSVCGCEATVAATSRDLNLTVANDYMFEAIAVDLNYSADNDERPERILYLLPGQMAERDLNGLTSLDSIYADLGPAAIVFDDFSELPNAEKLKMTISPGDSEDEPVLIVADEEGNELTRIDGELKMLLDEDRMEEKVALTSVLDADTLPEVFGESGEKSVSLEEGVDWIWVSFANLDWAGLVKSDDDDNITGLNLYGTAVKSSLPEIFDGLRKLNFHPRTTTLEKSHEETGFLQLISALSLVDKDQDTAWKTARDMFIHAIPLDSETPTVATIVLIQEDARIREASDSKRSKAPGIFVRGTNGLLLQIYFSPDYRDFLD